MANEPLLGEATFEANQAGDLGLLTFQLAADSFSDEAVNTVDRPAQRLHPGGLLAARAPRST